MRNKQNGATNKMPIFSNVGVKGIQYIMTYPMFAAFSA